MLGADRSHGTHLLIDLWGGQRLDDVDLVKETLATAASAAKATLLYIHLHQFELNGGITGIALLAESHISIHTWPEDGYAAVDIFTCGLANPECAIPVIERAFTPARTVVVQAARGVCAGASRMEAGPFARAEHQVSAQSFGPKVVAEHLNFTLEMAADQVKEAT